MRKVMYLAAALLAGAAPAQAAQTQYCGELRGNHYGPLDYRLRGTVNLEIVETHHFTPRVENLVGGEEGTLAGDLQYTLITIPNHHRALAALAKLARREKAVMLYGMRYPVECFFERASRFAPDDAAVYGVYGGYLYALGRAEEAMAAYQRAYAFDPANPSVNYNLGLLYVKRKDYGKALEHAHKAYGQNFPLPGLKQQLAAAGQWREPPPPAPEAAEKSGQE